MPRLLAADGVYARMWRLQQDERRGERVEAVKPTTARARAGVERPPAGRGARPAARVCAYAAQRCRNCLILNVRPLTTRRRSRAINRAGHLETHADESSLAHLVFADRVLAAPGLAAQSASLDAAKLRARPRPTCWCSTLPRIARSTPKAADEVTPIASVTKLMTAMVVLDAKQPMDETLDDRHGRLRFLKGSHSRLRMGTDAVRAARCCGSR